MQDPRIKGALIGARAGLISGLIAVLISLKYPFFIYAYLVMVLGSTLGAFFGVHYIRKADLNSEQVKLLFWSNTVAWIVPPIGFFTAAAARTINLRNHGSDRELFMRLTSLCFLLSFAGAIILAKYLT